MTSVHLVNITRRPTGVSPARDAPLHQRANGVVSKPEGQYHAAQ